MSSFFIDEILGLPEGKTLEFKRDLSSPKPLLKTLVAFANTAGGRLIVGVGDDKTVIGVGDPLDEEEKLSNLIADSIAPRLVPNIELTTVDGKTLLLVEVFLSSSRPHFLKVEGPEAGVYVRLGSSNRQADRELVGELRRSVEGPSFDEMPMPELSVDDLDLAAASQLFGKNRPLDEAKLITLRLLCRHQGRLVPTKGAVLLFGKERLMHFPDAWVQCGRFHGTEKINIFDHIEIDQPLPKALDDIMLFLKKHAYRGADLSEIRRKDVWSIPLSILREVVINALVHTDYSQRGAPIRVVFLDDRIEVENPGILLPGLTVEDVKQGTSKIRNNVIARVFRELNLIEQWGTGVQRIFAEAVELGLPEPTITEIGMRVRFSVPLLESITVGIVKRSTEQVSEQVGAPVSEQVWSLLLACSGQSKSRQALLSSVGLSNAYLNYKRHIAPLLEQGLLEMTVPDKPNSRLQNYRLTEQGRQALARHRP
jgi:predicted HTH transcriptional regulator